MNRSEIITRLREIGVISNGEIILRNGEKSEIYCDMRKSMGYPDIRNALAQEIATKVPSDTTVIATSGYGGLPLGMLVAEKLQLKFTGVRTSVKDHGKTEAITGYTPTLHDKVVIVDDVLTSGSSIRETFDALQKSNTHISSAIVIVARTTPILPLPYEYIFTLEELVETT